VDAQLDFLVSELQGPERRAAQSIFAAQDVPSAAAAIARDFLRPAPENLQKRVAQYTGGTAMQPQGLLGTVSTQGQEPEKLPFFQRPETANLLDTLAIGFSGMTLNPNQALIQSAQERIKGRGQAAQTAQQINKTLNYLRTLKTPEAMEAVRYAEATGDIAGALKMARNQPDRTALMQNYEYALSQGMTPEEARRWVSSATNINMPSQVGSIPPGYRVEYDDAGRPVQMVPVAGGPAAAEVEAAGRQEEMRTGLAEASTDVVLTAAQRARQAAANRRVGGVLGPLAAMNPATANAEVVRQVGTLQSMAAAENINAMRQASPTGGALGNASDADIMLLKQKSGALDPFSPNFERDLDDYERTLLRTIHGFEAGTRIYNETRGGLRTTTGGGGSTINGVDVGDPY
jgi:hypothetical protein